MERIGAEKDMGCWHYPEFTKGCWGSPRHELCTFCKVRYPFKLLGVFRRVRKTE